MSLGTIIQSGGNENGFSFQGVMITSLAISHESGSAGASPSGRRPGEGAGRY
jgi:hypothetical protein